MRSRTPKVLHPLCGRPLLLWPIEAAREAGAERIVVVLSAGSEVERALAAGRGRRNPAQAGRDGRRGSERSRPDRSLAGRDRRSPAIIRCWRRPSSRASRSATRARAPRRRSRPASSTTRLSTGASFARPRATSSGSSRRRIRLTRLSGELAIKEVNLGTYAFKTAPLLEALDGVRADNSQGELYLGDTLPLLRAAGEKVVAHLIEDELRGPRHQHARRPRRRAGDLPAEDPRAAHARRRHDHRSASTDDRGRRQDRGGHA